MEKKFLDAKKTKTHQKPPRLKNNGRVVNSFYHQKKRQANPAQAEAQAKRQRQRLTAIIT